MLEQEVASIIRFALDKADNPTPYYGEIKKDFMVPSIYFPAPEIDTYGETFCSYRMRYNWDIKFFHKSTEGAYALALSVLVALKNARNLIPVIDDTGSFTGENLRTIDPTIKKVDSGVYSMQIKWDSRHPYSRDVFQNMKRFYLHKEIRGGKNGTES